MALLRANSKVNPSPVTKAATLIVESALGYADREPVKQRQTAPTADRELRALLKRLKHPLAINSGQACKALLKCTDDHPCFQPACYRCSRPRQAQSISAVIHTCLHAFAHSKPGLISLTTIAPKGDRWVSPIDKVYDGFAADQAKLFKILHDLDFYVVADLHESDKNRRLLDLIPANSTNFRNIDLSELLAINYRFHLHGLIMDSKSREMHTLQVLLQKRLDSACGAGQFQVKLKSPRSNEYRFDFAEVSRHMAYSTKMITAGRVGYTKQDGKQAVATFTQLTPIIRAAFFGKSLEFSAGRLAAATNGASKRLLDADINVLNRLASQLQDFCYPFEFDRNLIPNLKSAFEKRYKLLRTIPVKHRTYDITGRINTHDDYQYHNTVDKLNQQIQSLNSQLQETILEPLLRLILNPAFQRTFQYIMCSEDWIESVSEIVNAISLARQSDPLDYPALCRMNKYCPATVGINGTYVDDSAWRKAATALFLV